MEHLRFYEWGHNMQQQYDIVVYGGTSAGMIAAVQAAQMGKSVVVIETGARIGGLTTSGLGATDAGDPAAIGGLSRQFYHHVSDKYNREGVTWRFEPKAALEVFQEYVDAYQIPVFVKEKLDLKDGVIKSQDRIEAIRMESGKTFAGNVFIDATYEGDLMAAAGVSYVTGRESNDEYGETLNGIQPAQPLPYPIDPYRTAGDPASGLLERVNASTGGEVGQGDSRTQAYNYRMCLTNDPENRIFIDQPPGYKEEDYELLFRLIESGYDGLFFKLTVMPGNKTDSNNCYAHCSTDYIGANESYAVADYKQREQMNKAHETYQKGLVWTLQNHPRVPERIKEVYRPWGLPLDEFTENNHWPPQLYVREARRMRGESVITEHTVYRQEAVHDVVALGSYAMDSHTVQYVIGTDGTIHTEGNFFAGVPAPFPISYRTIIPQRAECANLLVPVCLSATHAAYGSVRMEPVFMVLGQSAAIAAVLAAEQNRAVQDVDYEELRRLAEQHGQILDLGKDYVTPDGTTGNPI